MHHATFQNCSNTVISFIDGAQHTLVVGICWFTHPSIFKALKNACARKVQVRLILNYDHINFNPQGLDFCELEKHGAVIFAFAGPGLLHYKFAVSDDCRVLTGSYNWTRTDQCDHITVLEDQTLAARFSEALDAMAAQCQLLAQLRYIPPRHISFAQLFQPTLWSVQDLRKSVVAGAKTWLVIPKTEAVWQQWVSGQRHFLLVKGGFPCWRNNPVWDEQSFRNWLLLPAVGQTLRQLLSRYCLRLRTGDVLVAISPTGRLLGAGMVGSEPIVDAVTPEMVSRFVPWLVLKQSGTEIEVKQPSKAVRITPYKGSALALIASMERYI